MDLQDLHLRLEWKIKAERCKGAPVFISCSETLKIWVVAYPCWEYRASPAYRKFKGTVSAESSAASRNSGHWKPRAKKGTAGLGQEPVLLLQQTQASSHARQRCLAWRNGALAAGKQPDGCFYQGGAGEVWAAVWLLLCTSPVLLTWSRPHGCPAALLPSGFLALPGSSPPCLALGPFSPAEAPGGPLAASSPVRGAPPGRGLPPAGPGNGTPAACSRAVPETRFMARSLCNFHRPLQPSPTSARPRLRRGIAASGPTARVPRPLSPNGSPCARRIGPAGEPEAPAGGGGSPGHRPRGLPAPSDPAGHGQPRRAVRWAQPPLPSAPAEPCAGEWSPVGGTPRYALPRPLPSACLLLQSLGPMN